MSSEWLTESLMEEIIDHSPSLSDGISNYQDFNSKTYWRVFKYKCRTLSLISRRFANYKQLVEFITLFLNSWKMSKQRDVRVRKKVEHKTSLTSKT